MAARWPRPAWLTTDEAIQDDANPVAVLWDLWTHPRYGLGLPESRLNVTELNAVAQTLVAEGMGVSPVITRPMTYRELLVRLCECFDGYPTHDSQGRLGLALVRTGGAVGATIAEADLLDAPDFEPQGWHDTTSETFVRFTNRVKRFKEDSVAYRDRGNFQVTQSVRSQTLARPWVTRQAVATRIAWAAGRADALPTVSGTVRVRKSRAAGLAPGSLFALNFSQNGVADLIARVESITVPSPAKPEVTISFREDRAFLNHPHYLPPDDSDPVDEPFGTAPLSHEAVIELPYALSPDLNRHWLAALAARGDNLTNGMKVWVGVEGGDYISLDIVDGFALHGQVVAEYPAATRIIDEGVRLEIQLDSVDKTLDDEVSLDEALDNALLLFAGSEILSAFDLELVGLGHYRMSVVRARFDTKRKDHPAGEGVFVVRLSDLARFPHRTSRPSTNYMLQPFTLQHERDLASIAPLPFTLQYRARRPLCPLNLRVNGDGRTPTYGTGMGISASWDPSDPRRNAEGPTETLTPAVSRTVVELLTGGGVLKQTFAFAPTGPQTITNTQIVAALGAETDFVLRAWFESAGRRSLESDQITVRKV